MNKQEKAGEIILAICGIVGGIAFVTILSFFSVLAIIELYSGPSWGPIVFLCIAGWLGSALIGGLLIWKGEQK